MSRRIAIGAVVAALCAILIVASCVLSSTKSGAPTNSGPSPATGTRLRIATYNLNWGNRKLSLVTDAILRSKAHVVALQETTPASESHLKTSLGAHFPYMAFRGFKGKYYGERFGILSKYPITRSDFIDPQHGFFGAHVTVIKTDGGSVQIANVHLQPADVYSASGLVAAMKAVCSKIKGLTLVYDHLAGGIVKTNPLTAEANSAILEAS